MLIPRIPYVRIAAPTASGRRPEHRWAAVPAAFGVVVLLLCAAACSGSGTGGSGRASTVADAEALSWTHFEAPPKPAAGTDLVELGGRVYADNCAACHGERGAANGLCAAFLSPVPRDFTTGVFRFKTTPAGQMPTDDDLFRTVSLGVRSTGMPPWKFLLTEQERWAVVEYVKTLAPDFDRNPREPVDLGAEPPESALADEQRVDNGRRLYGVGQCAKCHGELGYGDGPSAPTLVDAFDNPIAPRNFHKLGQFKRGYTLRDIALTVHTGNNGTPMPAFDGAFTPEEIWDIAIYVMSLAEGSLSGGGTPASAVAGEDLGEPDVVVSLIERSWKYVPEVIRVQQGQVVRIDFQPTDNGLGVGHGLAIDGYDRVAFINGALVQRPKSVTFRADKAGSFTFYCASQCSTGPLHPNMKGTLVVEPAGRN